MICIGFGTNEKWTSKAIRWATKCEWSHCWIEFPSNVWGGRWVAHSGPDGIVQIPFENLAKAYPERCVYELKISVADLHDGFNWARKRISASYDYGVIWNSLLLVLWRATGWKYLWKLVSRNASKYSCSEFVSGFLVAAKVPGTGNMDPEITTPGDIRDFCDDSEYCLWCGHG